MVAKTFVGITNGCRSLRLRYKPFLRARSRTHEACPVDKPVNEGAESRDLVGLRCDDVRLASVLTLKVRDALRELRWAAMMKTALCRIEGVHW